jgi:hypothetical protein
MAGSDDDTARSEAEAALEREIRLARKFNPRDALARMAGPGALKGASPVSPVQQAETAVGSWLGANLPDTCGALRAVLHRRLKGSALLLDNLDRPLAAVAEYCGRLLVSDGLLREVVGEADAEWGRTMDERPYFEREGAPPHPDDPYTLEGVRAALGAALALLPEAKP